MGEILLGVFTSIALLFAQASAADNSPLTQFPLRTYLYEVQMQNPFVPVEKIKTEILKEADHLEPNKIYQNYEEIEKTMDRQKQEHFANLLREREVHKRFAAISIFGKKKMPLEQLVDALMRYRGFTRIEEAQEAVMGKVRPKYGDVTFAEAVEGISYEDQLEKFLRPATLGRDPINLAPANNHLGKLQERLAGIRARLEVKFKGQPEAVDAIMQIEERKALYGYNRELPEHLVLMGMPGSGKDTGINAYVDAIHNYEGAYKDHLFPLPIMKTKADLWKVLGSATGFVGSEKVSPFIRWLVNHSGGKYKIKEEESATGKKTSYVVENEEWQPGQVIAGYSAPEDAVVFVNEFHNWAKDLSDLFLKQALEKGYFEINDPGNGVNHLYVPVTFMVATNSGINLIASRELNGQRYGKPLTYEQMMARWEAAHVDSEALKKEMARVNGLANTPTTGEGHPGISEEMLNRLPNRVLMRPNSEETIREIMLIKVRDVQKELRKSPMFKDVVIVPTAELIDFLVEYDRDAEQAGRDYENKVKKLIEEPFRKQALSGKLELPADNKIYLTVATNTDGTRNLMLVRKNEQPLTQMMAHTKKDANKKKITDAEIDHILGLRARMDARVVSAEGPKEAISRRILANENKSRGKITTENATTPAMSFMLLGLSSTGKNEIAKAIASEHLNDPNAYELIDFSQVRTVEDLKHKILGTYDGHGNGIASPFMKAYDRTQGRILFVLDEIANAPREVLKALYDILREPVVTTFSDGKPRIMSRVMLLLNGNAGEELFQDIPRNIPPIEQAEAMAQIYEEVTKNPSVLRGFLEKFFSPALLNRVGMENIFLMPPLNAKAVRQLAQIKMMQALKELAPASGKRGWQIQFASTQDFSQLLNIIEDEGFEVWEQGASIDRYVKEQIQSRLEYELLAQKIPDGEKVTISVDSSQRATLQVTAGYKNFSIALTKKKKKVYPRSNEKDQILTAYHEAGHEIVSHILFHDKMKPKKISIIPGVTQIGERWIRYLGIAVHEEQERWERTEQAVLYEIAILAGGEVAQTLITQGQRHDAGKSNDMERATELATRAILKWGVSEVWGRVAVPSNQTISEYVASLTADRRKVLEAEVQRYLKEGREIARNILISNFDQLLVPMGNLLSEKGQVSGVELEQMYAATKSNIVYEPTAEQLTTMQKQFDQRFGEQLKMKAYGRDAEIIRGLKMPRSVANVDLLRLEARNKLRAEVELPANLPIGMSVPTTREPMSCQAFFKQGA